MKRTVVRYKVKPDQSTENASLIHTVFKELESKKLSGVRYLALQSGDGWVTHFTISDTEGPNPITLLDTFKNYVSGVRDRVVEPPQQANHVTVIGNYRMIDG